MTELTKKVTEYQKTGNGFEELKNRIYLLAYHYPMKKSGYLEDDYGDFLLHLSNRIPFLIQNFKYRGIDFEHYLSRTMKLALKRFSQLRGLDIYKRITMGRICELFNECFTRPVSANDNSDFGSINSVFFSLKAETPVQKKRIKKRLLILLLKNAVHINDNHISRFCHFTGYDIKEAENLVAEARDTVYRKMDNRDRYKERYYQCFFELLKIQHILHLPENREIYSEMKQKERRLKKRVKKFYKAAFQYNPAPTHGEIGRIINIPKGTIDSSLHYLKKNTEKNLCLPKIHH